MAVLLMKSAIVITFLIWLYTSIKLFEYNGDRKKEVRAKSIFITWCIVADVLTGVWWTGMIIGI